MNEQIDSYSFFTSLIFNIPDQAFIENILSHDYSSEAPGMEAMKEYVKSTEGKSIKEILDAVGQGHRIDAGIGRHSNHSVVLRRGCQQFCRGYRDVYIRAQILVGHR